MVRTPYVVVLCMLGLLASACGGGGSSAPTPSQDAAPTFVQQPLGQTVAAPTPATFTVAVSGSPAPTLQWQISSDAGATFSDIAGATTATYTTPATAAGDNGKQFRVSASNSAGSATSLAATLAVGPAGLLGFPFGLSVDAAGTVAVTVRPNLLAGGANAGAGFVQLLGAGGAITTLAGSATQGFVDATGPLAQFSAPKAVATDSSGNVFVADSGNNRIRKVTPTGVVSTHAGSGAFGSADGAAGTASFYGPGGVAVDSSGAVYVADPGQNTIRKISGGTVSTFAGTAAIAGGSADGAGAAARFSGPLGIAVDGSGTVYVADSGNSLIRKITPSGVVSTLAGGGGGACALQDGAGSAARFCAPEALAVDVAGNVYVADTANNAVRKVTPAGVVTTLAGNGSAGFVDATGSAARFNAPRGISVGSAGDVFVADTSNRVVRKVSAAGVVTTWAQ
jgi:hypothetical protein